MCIKLRELIYQAKNILIDFSFFEKIEKFDGSFFYEVRIRWEDGEAYTDIKNSKDELAPLLEELNKIVDKITEIKRQK